MNGPPLSAWEDWSALRRRFAGEALGNVLAFCGWQAGTGEWAGGAVSPGGGLLLETAGGPRRLEVGPVELLWQGKPLEGNPPDWPRSVSPGAARFFLTARPLGEAAVLDLDLAARRDENDPYYFTCSIQKRLNALLSRPEPEGRSIPDPFTGAGRALALAADRFPAAVRRAAECRDPFPVNRCALALAGAARAYLRTGGDCRPLLAAAGVALGNALGLLGVKPNAV